MHSGLILMIGLIKTVQFFQNKLHLHKDTI